MCLEGEEEAQKVSWYLNMVVYRGTEVQKVKKLETAQKLAYSVSSLLHKCFWLQKKLMLDKCKLKYVCVPVKW